MLPCLLIAGIISNRVTAVEAETSRIANKLVPMPKIGPLTTLWLTTARFRCRIANFIGAVPAQPAGYRHGWARRAKPANIAISATDRDAQFVETPESPFDRKANSRNTHYMTTRQTNKRAVLATELIRRGIGESGLSFMELERRTGVKRQSLMKFIRGEQSLRLDIAEKLFDTLGLELVQKQKTK